MKIIGETPQEWLQTSLLTTAHIWFYFLHDFRVPKQRFIYENSHRSIAASLLWYCDLTQTHIVTSLGSIVMRTFPSGSRTSSHRRQVDYHSYIIDNYSRRFHWLVCKKCSYYIVMSYCSLLLKFVFIKKHYVDGKFIELCCPDCSQITLRIITALAKLMLLWTACYVTAMFGLMIKLFGPQSNVFFYYNGKNDTNKVNNAE